MTALNVLDRSLQYLWHQGQRPTQYAQRMLLGFHDSLNQLQLLVYAAEVIC